MDGAAVEVRMISVLVVTGVDVQTNSVSVDTDVRMGGTVVVSVGLSFSLLMGTREDDP